jgi:HEAT repeat protein
LLDARAVDPLIASLKDSDSSVADSAAYALDAFAKNDELGVSAAEPLTAFSKRTRSGNGEGAAADALARLGATAVEALIVRMGSPDSQVRSDAIEALVMVGTNAVNPLIASLRDQDRNVRESAVKALGRIADCDNSVCRADIEPLLARIAVGDGDASVRAATVLFLTDSSTVAGIATRDGDAGVRRAAVIRSPRIDGGQTSPDFRRLQCKMPMLPFAWPPSCGSRMFLYCRRSRLRTRTFAFEMLP